MQRGGPADEFFQAISERGKSDRVDEIPAAAPILDCLLG